MEKEFNYDIAISFTELDRNIAEQIKSSLSKYKIFVYSHEQERLAGTDGAVEFNKIFESESCLVIILHRNNWGETPFTRIEKNAIQNRAFDKQSYDDFCLLVSMENPGNAIIPNFFPKRNIYLNFHSYGFKALLGVIENTFVRIGGEVKEPQSAIDVAKSMKATDDYLKKKRDLKFSSEGVEIANKEFEYLTSELKALSENTKQSVPNTFDIKDRNQIIICSSGCQMNVSWWCSFANDLEGSHLLVTFRKKLKPNYEFKLEKIRERYYFLDFDFSMMPCWTPKDKSDEFINSKMLADLLFREFFEIIKNSQKKAKVHARVIES